jgi:hypothetical protein
MAFSREPTTDFVSIEWVQSYHTVIESFLGSDYESNRTDHN